MTFGHAWNWLVLVALTLAGALVRLWFVARHKGPAPAWTLALGMLLVLATIVLLAPRPRSAGEPVRLSEVKRVLDARCLSCHAQKPTFQGLAEAPKGVKLDSEERIRAQAPLIRQSVRARTMPPGNLTGLTEDERALIERWNP
jgi:uncharacterized membrane protein